MLKESKYGDIICGHGIAGIPGLKMPIHLYLVDGLLIDTGPASMLKRTKEFIKKNGVEQVALTHIMRITRELFHGYRKTSTSLFTSMKHPLWKRPWGRI
jgi:hypothetical protein